MNLENIGKDCPCYEVDCSDIMFDIGEFCGLPPNNGKLTIQVNGSTVGDFSANQQEDETINITTPTSQDIADAVAGEALLRGQADDTLQSNIDAEVSARQKADRDIQAVLDGESLARVSEDRNLQSQIDAIASKSDVVDVVGTYAELQAYDTSKLNDNDVVKVLDDSTHNDSMTYYRWNKTTQTWSYIGQESPYYSKSQMDTLLATKQDNLTAGNGIDITGDTISADTTVLATKSDLESYAEKSNTYTKSEVDNIVEPKLSVDVVESLPAVGEESKLYLTPKAHTTQTATGNPISATITDGAGQIEDFQLDGDTFQQSYSGKNLFNIDDYSSAVLRGGGSAVSVAKENSTTLKLTNLISQGANFCGIPIPNSDNLLGKSVTISGTVELGTGVSDVRVAVYAGSSSSVGTSVASTNISASGNFTLAANIPASYPSNADRIHYVIYASGNTSPTVGSMVLYSNLQLEVGSATDYEPFVGGIASPNPSYPQPIQTVTGTQTISINGTDYPLDLGTIELCKLGTYQDYIYKDGSDWKIHREIVTKTFNGTDTDISSASWFNSSETTSTTQVAALNILTLNVRYNGRENDLMQHFVYIPDNTAPTNGKFKLVNQSGGKVNHIRVAFNKTYVADLDAAKTWIATNHPQLYFISYTTTNTAITDQTLITQLNAIASASLENGSNTITNTTTGSNLAGDMEVDYFGYDPTNRYDKWLWLDINNAYEKLGS